MIDFNSKEKENLGNGRDVVFTPNGQKIIYVDNGIWIMNSDGNNKTKISDLGRYPTINVDGTKIVYRHMNHWNDKYEIRLKEDKNGKWGL